MRVFRGVAGACWAGRVVSVSGMAFTRAAPVFSSSLYAGRIAGGQARRSFATAPFLVSVPQLAESLSEGEVGQILVKPGDTVVTDQQLFMIETEKANVAVNSPQAGTVLEILVAQHDKVRVGGPLLTLGPAGASSSASAPASASAAAAAPTKTKTAPPPPPSKAGGSVAPPPPPAATPAAAPAVAHAATAAKPAAPKPAATPAPSSSSSALAGPRTERRERLSKMRRVIAQRLKDSQNTYAMLTTFQECDMSALFAIRERYGEAFAKKHGGVKLGFMSAFVKAAATALRESPEVNGVIDGEDVVFRNYVDVSVAVASPRGLVVPVIRDADRKSFAEIERDISDLGDKARKDLITVEDMAGGTFTISNGGVFGSLMGTPIINPPQSAILGMHGINKRPVVITTHGKDAIEIRPMMYLALTYDHRLVDGREGVTFLRRIKQLVEDPARIVVDV